MATRPEVVDASGIIWYSEATGEPIDNPLPDLPFGMEPGLVSPMTVGVSCTSADYKVLYKQYADATTYAACYRGVGSIAVSNGTQVSSVVGVCPGNHSGEIRYQTYSGSHTSTRRGPYASNSTCFYFADSGVYPSGWSSVTLFGGGGGPIPV